MVFVFVSKYCFDIFEVSSSLLIASFNLHSIRNCRNFFGVLFLLHLVLSVALLLFFFFDESVVYNERIFDFSEYRNKGDSNKTKHTPRIMKICQEQELRFRCIFFVQLLFFFVCQCCYRTITHDSMDGEKKKVDRFAKL